MKSPLLLILLLLCSFPSRSQDLIHYEKAEEYSYHVYDSPGSDHAHKAVFFYFDTPTDSVLGELWQGYFDHSDKLFTRNGARFYFNKQKEIVGREYYIMGEKQGFFGGKEYFLGYEVSRIPLFEYRSIKKREDVSDLMFRLFIRESMVSVPSVTKGYHYNPYNNTIFKQGKEDNDNAYLNWWWPNLLKDRDSLHQIVGGIDFTFDFTPYKSDDHTPITVMLGNSSNGYYYLQIDNNGTTSLGETSSDGNRDILTVSKATQIKWGEKNHIRLQVSDNGWWYLEINDYKQSSDGLKHKLKMRGENKNVELSARFGMSNRIQAATAIDIHYLSLQQIELINEEQKTHPYNGMHRTHLRRLNNLIAKKLFEEGENINLENTALYLTSYQTDEESKAVLKTLNELSFTDNEEKTFKKYLHIEYRLDLESNAIKEVEVLFNSGKTVVSSAAEIYDRILKENDNYQLINGLLHHPNSRR